MIRWGVRIRELEIERDALAAELARTRARGIEAARILMAVRNVFGPVIYSDDAEGETWAKIDDWLTIKHTAACEFNRTGNCTCSQSTERPASETSAERCKHGVWAADRCEQCVAETDSKHRPLNAEERATVEQYLADVTCAECHCPKAYHRPGCTQSEPETDGK